MGRERTFCCRWQTLHLVVTPEERGMTRLFVRRLLLSVLLLIYTGNASAEELTDEQAIGALASRWEEGWNKRDAEMLGSIMAENVDFVSVRGPDSRGWDASRGRQDFINGHTKVFTTLFDESHWTTTGVDIRFLRSDVAVAHVLWETTGDKVRHLKHGSVRRGIFTWTLVEGMDGWQVAASQNTEAMPPLPGQ